MKRIALIAAGVLLAAGLSAGAVRAAEAELSVGVAAFETQAAAGAAVPDVATLLADRLGTRGVARIVGPAQLGAEADIDAAPEQVKGWAEAAGVDSVLVGRTTRVGDALSVEVRLRNGESGEAIRSFVQEIPTPPDLETSLDILVGRVLEAAAAPEPEPAVAAKDAPADSEQESPFGFKTWNSDEPLKINSDQLEAVQKEGRRKLVFRNNVHVQQGDLSIRCGLLEAFYPQDANQPDRLVARGNVRMEQTSEDQSASCDLAVYDRSRDHFTCKGNASFRDGDNTLRGTEIHVDLAKETVAVKGGAELFIHPDALGGEGS